jgi:Superfamily I DNA and RNA helicases
MANITKYLGAPGTGKTTIVINEFKKAVDSGINPKDILYNTYRREATRDAKKRIAEATGVAIRDLKFVKTMHGICLSLLYENGDVNPESVMQHADYKKFNTDCDYNIKPRKIIVDDMFAANDPYLSFYTTMKSSGVSLNDCCIIPSASIPN